MTGVFGSLLSDLRSRGVQVEIEGDKLVVEAPAGTLSETDRAALKATKPEILQVLGLEHQLLSMSLDEFERSDLAVEVRVPWLDVTLWWVPRQEHANHLLREGVEPGRLYTAKDLTNLTRLTGRPESRADIERIARLKLAFGASIVAVEDAPEAAPVDSPEASPQPCPACHRHRFWRSVHGPVVCGTCHPPAKADLVAEWLDAP